MSRPTAFVVSRVRAWLSRIHPTGAIIALALSLWSGALVVYALGRRYEVTPVNPRQVTKLDRFTGAIELCTRADRDSPLICQPAEEQ